MNLTRFIFASLASIIFIMGYNYLVHGVLLAELYNQTLAAWRPVEELAQLMPNAYIWQAVSAILLAYLFTLVAKPGGCIGRGLQFGMVMGLLIGGHDAVMYVYIPISPDLALAWFAAGFAQGLLMGLLLSLIYKPRPSEQAA